MQIDRDEIARLTEERGGAWGINHTRRLLKLVERIGAGLAYDQEAIWVAAHLHDWGAYAPWAQKGVDHVERSVQVAGEYLTQHDCPPDLKALHTGMHRPASQAGRRPQPRSDSPP